MRVGVRAATVRQEGMLGPSPHAGSSRRSVLTCLVADRAALVGVIVLLIMVVTAAFAPAVAPFSPTDSDVAIRLRPPLSAGPDNAVNILGTDPLGRDVLSRVIHGARVSLLMGFVAVVISATLGLILGVIAGYVGGWVGDVIMRIADIQLAFPFILLAIAVVAVVGPGIQNIVLVLGIGGWVIPARVVRAEVLSLREREFVQAARLLGASPLRIVSRHVVPNVLPSMIVIASFAVAQVIIVESALSFVGVGIRPPTPSWGAMMADGQNYLTSAWWVSTAPGVALMLTVLSINLVGDFLRDVLDPRLRA